MLTLEGDCYIAEIRIIWMSAANLSPLQGCNRTTIGGLCLSQRGSYTQICIMTDNIRQIVLQKWSLKML